MALQRFSADELAGTPWKNGGGVTREIVCRPPGAGFDAFEWRISIAHVVADGAFSTFEGVDRVITLLAGEGLRLRARDGRIDHRLDRLLAPFGFAGEAPVDAELLAGECLDLNVMTRRAACRARVEVLRASGPVPGAAAGLLLAVGGHWQACDAAGAVHDMPPRHGLWWDAPATGLRLLCPERDAAALAVLIDPVAH